jgi:phage portal protein BeeE
MADKGVLGRLWSWLNEPVGGGTKGLTILRDDGGFIPANVGAWGGLPRTSYSYHTDIGMGLDSNVIMSPVGWIMRNFTEADVVVERKVGGAWEAVDDHDFTSRLDAPNPFYDADILLKATAISWALDGNAYWQKVRNPFGEVLGYWYVPHFMIEPKWPNDGSVFISHYEYRPGGGMRPIDFRVGDIVHFRNGLDPRNTRLGFSSLKPVLREVFTDEEAANFSATILRNMGVPGGIISPKAAAITNADEALRLKEHMTGFTGDKRGEWLVFGVPTEAHQFGFDPNNLMLGNLRDIAEERVCAALGIPAAVVGFGSGLQQTKVGATMREMRKEAWDSCITPMQNSIARQLTKQALPDFQTQLRRFRVRFDNSAFAASQEEEMDKARRVALLCEKGILRVDRGQKMLNLEVDPTRAIYLTDGSAGGGADEGGESDGSPDDELLRTIAARANGATRNGA